MYVACPQHGYLRLSGPPLGEVASGGARTRNKRAPADLRANWLSNRRPNGRGKMESGLGRAPVLEEERKWIPKRQQKITITAGSRL
ncbi:hypothetical protein PoB_006995700 [Plakobranchus ocellatus]|uniref:Uncharacterized protein n=1 Tax=Plakobranchus ocellatus TaxID=259542 RepID=A0AAV4DGR7_9GAST|nr:hypothetical protein PoB_006995700 [Plakobranchus ocellatus]